MAAERLVKPVFILGCNRSGTTLLFNNLSYHPVTWSLYVEGQDVFHRHYPVDPRLGELVDSPPSPAVAQAIRDELFHRSHNKEIAKDHPLLKVIPRKALQRPLGRLYRGRSIRLVEKTPANTLRVPLVDAIFSDAVFLFLVRRGEDVVSSLMEGWKNWSHTGEQVWSYTKWHYLVPPGWQEYRSRPLAEICAFQWAQSIQTAWESLNRMNPAKYLLLRHEDLMERPNEEYERILQFCQLPPSAYFDKVIRKIEARVYTTGGSKPRPEKWRQLHEREIESVRHLISPVNQQFYG